MTTDPDDKAPDNVVPINPSPLQLRDEEWTDYLKNRFRIALHMPDRREFRHSDELRQYIRDYLLCIGELKHAPRAERDSAYKSPYLSTGQPRSEYILSTNPSSPLEVMLPGILAQNQADETPLLPGFQPNSAERAHDVNLRTPSLRADFIANMWHRITSFSTSFNQCKFDFSAFNRCDFTECQFIKTTFNHTHWNKCHFYQSNFTGTDIHRAVFENCYFDEVDFTSIGGLQSAKFINCKIQNNCTLSPGQRAIMEKCGATFIGEELAPAPATAAAAPLPPMPFGGNPPATAGKYPETVVKEAIERGSVTSLADWRAKKGGNPPGAPK